MLIASAPDREHVYLEIWLNDEMIAEMTNENGELKVIFYFDKNPWEFDYWVFVELLEEGRNKLLGKV